MEFQELTFAHIDLLRKYYVNCDYRLCEYSAGVKLMWRHYLHPAFAQVAGCLVISNVIEGVTQFDFPIPGEEGNVDAALTAIEAYCTRRNIRPVISVVPESMAPALVTRWPKFTVLNEEAWKDYVYLAEDLAALAGRRYSGQRNHINKFRKEHPTAVFRPLTAADEPLLQRFWQDYAQEFSKHSDTAEKELALAREMFAHLDTGAFRAGGMEEDGRLLGICLAEKCGDTLVDHIEKALYSCQGVYPAMVQAFAAHYGGDCRFINREDDARDRGLRISKRQYLPTAMDSKMSFRVGSQLDLLDRVPDISCRRLTLTAPEEGDKAAYNALCLDDARNRWWGYDYREDLHGELTEDYFLSVAREDFRRRMAVNWAVRLDGRLIGEAVLYNHDWRGGMELGCRIAPDFAGHGYGTEAFAAAADWALYRLGLKQVVAKCFRENDSSRRMLESCMRQTGEDEKFFYFRKVE